VSEEIRKTCAAAVSCKMMNGAKVCTRRGRQKCEDEKSGLDEKSTPLKKALRRRKIKIGGNV
jgi:hypothetical protein